LVVRFRPAFVAVIIELTITLGGTFLILIPINSPIPTLTLEKIAVIHRLTGTKYRNMKSSISAANAENKIKAELDISMI
jgi:hypothetical protein